LLNGLSLTGKKAKAKPEKPKKMTKGHLKIPGMGRARKKRCVVGQDVGP